MVDTDPLCICPRDAAGDPWDEAAGEDGRNRRPHVSASKTPTANALARLVSRASGSLAERGAELPLGNEGTLSGARRAKDKAQRWQSGSVPKGSTADTLVWRLGV